MGSNTEDEAGSEELTGKTGTDDNMTGSDAGDEGESVGGSDKEDDEEVRGSETEDELLRGEFEGGEGFFR